MRRTIICTAVFLLVIALPAAYYASMRRRGFVADLARPAISPSGRYLLKVERAGQKGLSFSVYADGDHSGEDRRLVYRSTDSFSADHVVYFLWDDSGRVWVYSGDVGTFFWEEDGYGKWTRRAYVDSDVPAPSFLKKIRPEQHYR